MKTFLKAVWHIKATACIYFTVAVFLMMAAEFLTGQTIPTTPILWQALLISVAGAFWQAFCYTPLFLKKMRYSGRNILFLIPFFAFLSGCAVWFRWFPVEYFVSWLIFVGIFLALFLILSGVFSVYCHITGEKYNDILKQYRKEASQ